MKTVCRHVRPTKDLLRIVEALIAAENPSAALATLVRVDGSSYRRPGARLLLFSDGKRIGSVSGGCLEEDVIAHAQRVIATGKAETMVYDTTSENDLVWGVGLGCHGIVRVLVERVTSRPDWAVRLSENFADRRVTKLTMVYGGSSPDRFGTALAEDGAVAHADCVVQSIRPPTALFVLGAGDDVLPLVRLAKELGWVVTVADPRPALATRQRFPEADHVLTGKIDELVAGLRFDPDSVAVIMTHHYVHDRPLLRALLPQPLAYLGLLGPRQRAERILADLAADGFTATAEQRSGLHAPVGLDLGADGPEQVALAITAEVQAALAGRDGQPLRERDRPIHD